MVPHSLKNVSAKWIFEVREHMPNKPVLLGKYDGLKTVRIGIPLYLDKCSTQNE